MHPESNIRSGETVKTRLHVDSVRRAERVRQLRPSPSQALMWSLRQFFSEPCSSLVSLQYLMTGRTRGLRATLACTSFHGPPGTLGVAFLTTQRRSHRLPEDQSSSIQVLGVTFKLYSIMISWCNFTEIFAQITCLALLCCLENRIYRLIQQ